MDKKFRIFQTKECSNCGASYLPTGAKHKYCSVCGPKIKKKVKFEYGHRQDIREKQKAQRNKYKLSSLYSNIKYKCGRENISFNLEFSDLHPPRVCPVLNTEFITHTEHAMSIDRIDPTKGYTKGNVQIMSLRANQMKSNATPEELLKFAKWINRTYGDI